MNRYTVDNQPTYRCLTCEDAGTVIVWEISAMRAIVAKWPNCTSKIYRGAVLCNCDAGRTLGKRESWSSGATYEPELMLLGRLSPDDPQVVEAMRARLAKLDDAEACRKRHEWNPYESQREAF